MTGTSPVAITHPATEPFPVTAPLNSPIVNGAISDSVPPDEEEPYTIKCICAFEDDDGNTVFCEGCETWQHIECYYHARDVPDVHNCVDCEPRHLDGRRATERQKRLREQSDGGDRKAKRSGAKSHKKKVKDHGDQVNGFHQRSESSSRDQPPPKKTKTSHRASGSVSSLSGIPVLNSDGRKRTAGSMSPTKTSGPTIPLYSREFLHLYDQDQGLNDSGGNIFATLPVTKELTSWVHNPDTLSQVANGRPAEVFTQSGAALDKSRWPLLSLETTTDSSVEIEGQHPTWKVLKTQSGVSKDEIVGEITGTIGLLRDYSLDPSNRWQELRHPEPFVFFHPQLPIYIDARQEGSVLRYARRSCRPNVTMKTYITNDVEYHFCFVAKEDIAPDTEITTTWYLDAQLFGSTNGIVKQEPSESVPEMAAICISNVLANFGGCACIPPPNCFLSSLDRRRHPKLIADGSMKQAHAKRRKTKSKSTVSPPNNSRAGSETVKNAEDDDHADSRSASSSTRGQTRSRDLTPTLQTPTEVFAFGESELSARERRKIAAAEKKFQQLEQDQQVPHKRKKRVSGQSSQTPGASTYGLQSHSPPLSAGKPSGPSTPSTQSASGHSQYVDSAVQAELDVSNGVLPSPPSSKRPNFIPLTQRLLKRCHTDRIRLEHTSRQQPVSPQSNKSAHEGLPHPPAVATPTATTPSVSGEREDVEMRDLDSPTGSARSQTRNPSVDISPSHGRGPGKALPLTSPWPSSAAHITRLPAHKATSPHVDLQVPLPPATATFHPSTVSPISAVSSAVSSPSTLDHSSHHSTAVTAPPGAGLAAPSPVKKKLSLGDYLSRRGSLKTPTSEKIQAQTTAMPPPTAPIQPSERRDGLVKTNNTQAEVSSATQLGSPTTSDVTIKDVPDSMPTADPPSVS
ncbi:putative PHD finger and SET domain protein [Aspergillus undulatus]|uniref:putative PHD finger and SET domain protein n=1 Tax=Aspergillus undulatus TaxID=1810928 RepID=UPI003CCCCCCA